MIRILKPQILLAALLATVPATSFAEDFALKYTGTWNKMKVGEMRVYVDEEAQTYKSDVMIDTMGLIKMLTKYIFTDSLFSKLLTT